MVKDTGINFLLQDEELKELVKKQLKEEFSLRKEFMEKEFSLRINLIQEEKKLIKKREESNMIQNLTFFKSKQLAQFLHLSPRTIANWRSSEEPQGPVFCKSSGKAIYHREDVFNYLNNKYYKK